MDPAKQKLLIAVPNRELGRELQDRILEQLHDAPSLSARVVRVGYDEQTQCDAITDHLQGLSRRQSPTEEKTIQFIDDGLEMLMAALRKYPDDRHRPAVKKCILYLLGWRHRLLDAEYRQWLRHREEYMDALCLHSSLVLSFSW